MLADASLWENFHEYAEHSPVGFQEVSKEHLIASHNLCVLHMFDKILKYYEREPQEVNKFYKMIGISHMIMGIPENKFWVRRFAFI